MEVIALAEAGHLRPVTTRFALGDVDAAYAALESGELQGRAVVVP